MTGRGRPLGALAVTAALAGLLVSAPAASTQAMTTAEPALRSAVQGADPMVTKPSSLRPEIRTKLIPFHHKRKMQTARYSKRHYGRHRYRLRGPRVIVEHYTDGPSMLSAWWTMANNNPNLGESPGVCTHFIVDKRGRIWRVAPLELRCRHTIGLNQTAIGIEHVGTSDRDVLGRERQRRASFRLTLWLMARYDIAVRNVIGHGESLHSPLRHERYRSWRCLTHTDFSRPAMQRYRKQMRRLARAHDVRIGPRPSWVRSGC